MRAPTKAERQLECFLEMLAAERGAARNTSDAYRRDLSDYIAHLSRSGAEPATATLEHLRDYLGALQHRGMSAATQARRVSALRQFHNSSMSIGTEPTIPQPRSRGRAAPRARRAC